jgi:hypothetical protein
MGPHADIVRDPPASAWPCGDALAPETEAWDGVEIWFDSVEAAEAGAAPSRISAG